MKKVDLTNNFEQCPINLTNLRASVSKIFLLKKILLKPSEHWKLNSCEITPDVTTFMES